MSAFQSFALGSFRGIAYHFKDGPLSKILTFIPKKPTKNVSGKKMKVIQLRRHRLAFSERESLASLMLTDLYSFLIISKGCGSRSQDRFTHQIYHLVCIFDMIVFDILCQVCHLFHVWL
jgi:hypothetical protein